MCYFINILGETIPYFLCFRGAVLYNGIRVTQVLEEIPLMKRIRIFFKKSKRLVCFGGNAFFIFFFFKINV